jgi:hypothetical protein
VVADRGYCHAREFHYAAEQGAVVTVRLNPHGIRLQQPNGSAFELTSQAQKFLQTS